MTFIEKFNEIQKKFDGADVNALSSDFAVQVNLTDEDCGGAFYVAFINGQLDVQPYDYHDNTAMLTISADNFVRIISGKLDPMAGEADGKLQIIGDAVSVLALAKLKGAAKAPAKKKAEKPAAKKPAEKKTEVKKVEAKKPEVKKVEAKKPEVKKVETKKPEAKKAEAKKPAAKKTEVKKTAVKPAAKKTKTK